MPSSYASVASPPSVEYVKAVCTDTVDTLCHKETGGEELDARSVRAMEPAISVRLSCACNMQGISPRKKQYDARARTPVQGDSRDAGKNLTSKKIPHFLEQFM